MSVSDVATIYPPARFYFTFTSLLDNNNAGYSSTVNIMVKHNPSAQSPLTVKLYAFPMVAAAAMIQTTMAACRTFDVDNTSLFDDAPRRRLFIVMLGVGARRR